MQTPSPLFPGIALLLLLFTAAGAAANAAPQSRTRESFDAGWRFARFGPMPDGSRQAEPGASASPISASSEQSAHDAAKALDGDIDTRWSAANDSPGAWLSVDLGRETAVVSTTVEWEKSAPQAFRIETSEDGKTWSTAFDQSEPGPDAAKNVVPIDKTVQYVRLTVLHATPAQWPSVREWTFTGADGKEVQPQPSKPPVGDTPASPTFDDSTWRNLDLPHDWGIEGPFRADLPNNTGKLPWAGIGWYRKTLTLSAEDEGRRIFLDFDGAMSHPKVFVNGRLAGEWAYGYSSFRVEITDFVRLDKPNLIAVRLDNPPDSSRWYPGGGIYRHLWIEKTAPVHVAHWGVFVLTPDVSEDQATVAVRTTVRNQSDKEVTVTLHQVILNPVKKNAVAEGDTIVQPVAPGQQTTPQIMLTVNKPKRWDVDSPTLYLLRTTVLADGEEVDRVDTRFGIRSIEWNADLGFLLNGRVVQLKGVCNHHDLGPLGAAVNTRALERQLELLREMGCNAIRTSHNPPAPELLELCDRQGFLVLDELFDCWQHAKTPNDYSKDFDTWHERDVRNFVHRDRNHPCVIAWSSGNEIREQSSPGGQEISRQLTALFHQQDPTRLVGVACNDPKAGENGFSETIDLMGYNYKPHLYEAFHARYPDQPVFGSETASCVSSRGEYFFPVDWDKSKGLFNFQVSSYDLYAPRWAMRPDIEFEAQDKYPFVAGEFVWTGFDYLGEPTPYNVDKSNALNFTDPEERRKAMALFESLGGRSPSRSSYFGILDLCGFKKDRFYLYQAKWRPDLRMVHVLPHWNWPDRVGQVTPVHVYTTGDEAELFINGHSLGRKHKEPYEYRLHWDDVIYQPGELKVIAYKNGKKWAETVRRTTGDAHALRLEPDRIRLHADGRDLSFVTVRVVDANGDMVPNASDRVKFSVEGPMEIAAVGNGDATSQASFQASERSAFNGMCLVILRSEAGRSGAATLTASAEGLASAKVKLHCVAR